MNVIYRIIAYAVIAIAAPVSLAAHETSPIPIPGQNIALADFDHLLSILREDYAGFEHKTVGDQGAEYEKVVKEARAAIIANPAAFGVQVVSLLEWFDDRHLGLEQIGPVDPPTFGNDTVAAIDYDTLKSQGRTVPSANIEAGLAGSGSLVGEWQTIDGVYKLALIPDPANPAHVVAVIRETTSPAWAPGQVKFSAGCSEPGACDVIYRMGDHSERLMSMAKLADGNMLKLVGNDLVVYFERSGADHSVYKDRLFAPKAFTLTRLSAHTMLLRLPNFASENRSVIEGLLATNHEAITTSENLLIDLRYNSGGSDDSYSELMRYLYTRPIYTIGTEFRSSARNIARYEDLIERYRDDLDDETLQYLADLLAKARARADDWVKPFEEGFIIRTYPEVMPLPKRVGILTEGAGSSGDQFVIDARASKKVTTFGKPTAGIIDYSNVVSEALPSGHFELQWPTTRSLRLPQEPFDNVGVMPDVPFDEEVSDPIAFAQAWLERQTD